MVANRTRAIANLTERFCASTLGRYPATAAPGPGVAMPFMPFADRLAEGTVFVFYADRSPTIWGPGRQRVDHERRPLVSAHV
jgi:hypothetical protein